ncbi:MAG TPA: bestrophin family ion channel [Cyclobacteriaceae bacterium]|jgi:putative membrane protein|nr:bestrophin family ion channel [Cyclobacteriaceae bacterium]
MVTYNPKTWLNLIFHAYSKQVVKTLQPALLSIGVFTAVLCLANDYFELDEKDFPSSTVVHSLLGIVLGLFLVFRTNSAYDRWWEGRRLWGGLVNSTRNFALKLNAILPADSADRKWFAQMISNFTIATKEQLRNGVQLSELEIEDEALKEKMAKAGHKPNFISSLMYQKVEALSRANVITGFHLVNLDKEMKDFIDLMGGCERIKKTPIPYSYTMYIKKFLFIYIITLPFGFLETFGYYTIPTVILVSFILLSVELIAEEIEDPFGRDVNDLPTDDISATIKANVREILL